MLSGLVNSMKGLLGWDTLEVESSGENGANSEQQVNIEERKSLFKQLYNFVGKDITSGFSLPVWVFEPLSFLQILAEPMIYGDLLFKASECDDPSLRLAYLTAFILGGYKCATRTKKPFNPLLGETFEFVSPNGKYKVFAEQVSHHPPIGVCEVICDAFYLHLEMELTSKFRGNSSDVQVFGTNYIRFPRTGDYIVWEHLDTCAHNVLIGGMWVDHFGEIEIQNKSTGDKCMLKVTKTGWLGAGRYETNADIVNPQGELCYKLTGKWNEIILATKFSKDSAQSAPVVIWKTGNEGPVNKWGWPKFTQELNAYDKAYEAILPPSDSRFRADRRALELDNLDLGSKEKVRLEEEQRAKRKAREASGEVYFPKYFKKVDGHGPAWEYCGHYWEEREERIAKQKEEVVSEGVSKIQLN